jgi:F-type H+-transporting ATPase subunit b
MAQKVTTSTAQPEPGAHTKVFPPLDHTTYAPQLVWLALSFGLLYVLLSRVALPRIRDVIEERAERIQRDLKQAEKLKAQTEDALKGYEQALAEARSKASAIAKGMRDELAAEIEDERGKLEAQIAHKVAEAEARIAQTKSRALASVNEIAADTAGAIVAKLLGSEVSKDEVRKALIQRAAE